MFVLNEHLLVDTGQMLALSVQLFSRGGQVMPKQKSTPEEVKEQLRAVRSTLEDDVEAMTAQKRRDLRDRIRHSPETLAAAMSAVGTSNKVAAAVGMTMDDVKDLIMLATRWAAVES